MTKAILLLIGLQAAGEPPLIPAFFTGEALYAICSRPNGGQCSMYVAGVLDGLFYARSRGGAPLLCPAPINNRQAAERVTQYLAQDSERRQRAAALLVREALADRLACNGDAGTERPTER
ncbi:Rap1a/Tai family immunity protein [Sphingosinicella terrae]|uniref:Rap1a/Tai family immunity protein n=1 Tax=Sphingosinicella terrae TaxID=2172047 RepID=UPI000E0CDB19|nr:Rap1a/Tai family immunity protein [Sphingosinicella terrae]